MSDLRDMVREKAELAVEQFSARARSFLNYSRESLSAVEEMLGEASDFVAETPDQQIETMIELFGCYILEVGFQEFGGQFQWFDQHNQPVLIVGEPDFHVAMITFDKVRGRLGGDEGDNIPFFYNGFAAKASAKEPSYHALYV